MWPTYFLANLFCTFFNLVKKKPWFNKFSLNWFNQGCIIFFKMTFFSFFFPFSYYFFSSECKADMKLLYYVLVLVALHLQGQFLERFSRTGRPCSRRSCTPCRWRCRTGRGRGWKESHKVFWLRRFGAATLIGKSGEVANRYQKYLLAVQLVLDTSWLLL